MLPITTKPGKKYASLKRPDIYEALRRQGMSKQRAARISNAQANKDASTVAGSSLHGPGGVLGTPGMGSRRRRKWGNRRKDKACTCGVNVATKESLGPGITRIRGNLCNVHGRYGPCDGGASAAKKPKGKKGRKPAKPKLTPEQRAQQRTAQQQANRAKVFSQLGLPEDATGALEDLRSGIATTDDGGLVKMGLAEQAADGSYRLTASGRALANAAAQGDVGRARDTISAARDRLGARQGRQAAAEQRKQAVAARRAAAQEVRKKKQEEAKKKRGASGGKKQTGGRGGDSGAYQRQQREAERQADRERRLAEHQEDRARRLREHEEDRARREAERTSRTPQQPTQQATAPAARVSGARPEIVRPSRKRGRMQRSNVGTRTKEMTATFKAGDPGDYLVVEDRNAPSTWHLQVRKNGKVDHRLLGAAWAALHGGYRGNKYEGPNKGAALSKLRKLYEQEDMPMPSEKSFTVFKSDDGSYRWIARTTTAYRDRDDEDIPIDTLDRDSQRMTESGLFGPLRWWHLGKPDPFALKAQWGPGVDIGDCDYSTQIGTSRVESGTFRDPRIAQRIAETADEYELSPGFFHPYGPDGPPNGSYKDIRTFERSIVPIRYGRASNLFTGLTVKEFTMELDEMERRFKAAIEQLKLSPDQAEALSSGLVQADKSARQSGLTPAFKTTEEITINGQVYTLKADMAPASMEEAAETEMDDALEEQVDEGDDGGEYVGDMSPAAFKSMLAEVLAPVLKMQEMVKAMTDMHGELKGMMGGATKSASEITTLKAQIADATKRLALLEGDQPAVVTSADVEAALKGAPQAPPDPNAPIVPDDPNRPFAAVAARTFPNLYRQNPDGSFAGWQQHVPPSNS